MDFEFRSMFKPEKNKKFNSLFRNLSSRVSGSHAPRRMGLDEYLERKALSREEQLRDLREKEGGRRVVRPIYL